MCIIYIVFAELLRAYSSRSLRHSVFQIGFFSNRWMQYGTFTAVCATIIFCVTPGLQDVFGMVNLEGREV
jgi:Ca2+-transporting ATPase